MKKTKRKSVEHANDLSPRKAKSDYVRIVSTKLVTVP